MTSLQLFPATGGHPMAQKEWGTGAQKVNVPLWSSKSPTWHYTGEPIQQYYGLTKLRKSNVRWNDQLLPKPQEVDMSLRMIDLPFPAENPYSSHTSRVALFPSFAILAEESKRGVAARDTLPLGAETPANAFDVHIVNKVKGFGSRHEVQAAPPESLKRGLTWHGGKTGFDQLVKAHNEHQSFYPWPIKTVMPNLVPREGDLAVSDRTAESTRNLERQQWQTKYDLDFTGLGPANPLNIDNYEENVRYHSITGQEEDRLNPHFNNTFDPARPYEGRIAEMITPHGPPLTKRGAAIDDTNGQHQRKLTLTEREEQRLLNGGTYLSLPERRGTRHADKQWHEWSATQEPEPHFSLLTSLQQQSAGRGSEAIELQLGSASDTGRGITYLDALRQSHLEKVQQLEASNRWQQLESQTPSHDIAHLGRKLQLTSMKDHPAVFYGHEGLYNEERAGLYKTTYDPARLQPVLDPSTTQPTKFDTFNSHVDALAHQTPLNAAMDAALSESRTLPASGTSFFSDRPLAADVLEPHTCDMAVQARILLPSASSARSRVQEGSVVLTQSEHGGAYNTEKFLQQHVLPLNVRSESLSLMSVDNRDLGHVRSNAAKKVRFDNVPVGSMPRLPPATLAVNNAETVLATNPPAGNAASAAADWMQMTRNASSEAVKAAARQRSRSAPDMLVQNQFRNKATNIMPPIGTVDETFRTSYDSQFRSGTSVLGFKCDDKFAWTPGCGVPRPQGDLLRLQNHFTKSDAHHRLHASFTETNPSLIKNIHTGKKHEFSLNAQVLRGAEVH